MPEKDQSAKAAHEGAEALRRLDAAMLEGECGVRPGKGESAMRHVPKPLLKGWRQGVNWKVVDGAVYLSSALVPLLRKRIQAVQADQGKKVEEVMDACRRRELAEEKAARERERLRLFSDGPIKKPTRRRRTGDVYVPVKDRS
jgi:hypothetical protein